MTTLFQLVNNLLPKHKISASDENILTIDIREYTTTELSPINGFRNLLPGKKMGWRQMLYLSMLDSLSTSLNLKSARFHIFNDNQYIPAFFFYLRSGLASENITIINRTNRPTIDIKSDFLMDEYKAFINTPVSKKPFDIDIIFSQSTDTERALEVVDLYSKSKRALLFISDVGLLKHNIDMNIFYDQQIDLKTTLEGHGWALKGKFEIL